MGDVVVAVVIGVVLVVMVIVRLRHSVDLQESARGRPLRSAERVVLVVAVLAAMGIGAWLGFR